MRFCRLVTRSCRLVAAVLLRVPWLDSVQIDTNSVDAHCDNTHQMYHLQPGALTQRNLANWPVRQVRV